MVIAYLPFIFVLTGLLMWGFASNGKVQEIGKILFFAGTLALALGTNGFGVRLLH